MSQSPTVSEILNHVCYRRIDVEHVLDRNCPSWIRFDPELGYVPNDIVMRDGMDFTNTTYTHGTWGERLTVNYADRPCRMNTYGDSFTQSQQVSDDETWQERLAAHYGEPVRNFGSGGYSVVSAVRRAMRMEQQDCGAQNVLLNVFVDDHVRNLDAARWIRTAWAERDWPADRAYPLHGLPWTHIRYDLDQRKMVMREAFCRGPEDLLALTDKKVFHDRFHRDQIVRLFTLMLGGEAEMTDLEALAEEFGVKVDLRNPATRAADARTLQLAYGFRTTEYLLDEFRAWLTARGKRLLVLTSYCVGTLSAGLEGRERLDQPFIDFLQRGGYDTIDILPRHCEDFADFSCGVPGYIGRYYIKAAGAAVFGHYNPMGNMFYAMAIKDDLVKWLEPNPPAYHHG